jgi:hypothetical protein
LGEREGNQRKARRYIRDRGRIEEGFIDESDRNSAVKGHEVGALPLVAKVSGIAVN